jgi:hypothetical protein
MPDMDGNELHSSPIVLKGRDEGEAFLGLLRKFVVVAEVFVESDFHENEGA